MKKKVMFVAPNLHHGGAEAVLVKILNNIDLNNFDIELVLLQKKGNHLAKLRKDIQVVDLKANNAIDSIIKLKKIISNKSPDYIFSIIGHVNLMLALLKMTYFKSIKFIGRENVVYSEYLYQDKNFKKILLKLGYKLLLKRLDIVVVQSNYMANQVKSLFKVKEQNIKVLNNPIEHSVIEKMLENSEGVLYRGKKNLLAVGRLESVKNYHDMINIVSELPDDFHLSILGDGREKANLSTYINEKNLKNKVTLHSYVENPYIYMKEADLLLLTSNRESFPNVVIEANACGTYVISYNMPGGVSEILDNPKRGSLVELGDINAFRNKILEVSNKSYNGKEITETTKKYSIENYITELSSIFN